MSVNVEGRDNFRKRAVDLNLPHTYMEVPDNSCIEDHDEKPWQRVPSPFIVILLGFYLLLGYVTQLVEDDLPRAIKDADIPKDRMDVFSEESAWRYLHQIMGDEPRVAGTVYHLNKTRDLKSLVDSIAVAANQNVRTDWQIATGEFWLNSIVNYYQEVSNIIAVLEGKHGLEGTNANSILINCHYDSVPYALGASDNVVFCAAMAETLSKLSKRTRKFKHNVIFLFNGAEENPLQGSPAFLQHSWSRNITAVVNLDSAGMNGKAAVFQVTDSRVLNAFKRSVSRPNAQSIGEFLFSTGIIPSDTDFRIWRDLGQFQGIDIAFAKWGSVYHTRYDHPDLLKSGVLQWSGDMLMSIITELADMDELNEIATPQTAVYYDYLNMFLITYSLSASYAVDILIAVFGFSSVAYYIWLVGPRMSTVQGLLHAVFSRLYCVIAGVMVFTICVILMVATTIQLRYMSRAWLVVPLYWMPCIITAVVVSHLNDTWRTTKSGLNRSLRTLQAMAATRVLMSIGLLLLVCIPSLKSTRYLISVPLFIMAAVSLISLTVVRYVKLRAWQHLILESLLSLPSTMFMFSLVLRLNAILLPTMGRSPTNTPDYTVAEINVGLAIIVSSTVSGIELLFSRRRLWISLCTVGVVCMVLMFIPFNPYSDEGPTTQRHYWFHTEITSYNMKNEQIERIHGVLVSKVDAYTFTDTLTALQAAGIHVETRHNFTKDCDTLLYCNLPVFRPSFQRYVTNGLFLYTGAPDSFKPPASLQLTTKICDNSICNYTFTMTGAAHNLITIWPRHEIKLTSWTFSSPSLPMFHHLDRPVYVVFHSAATYRELFEPLIFNVTFNIPLSMQSESAVEVSHHSHEIHRPQDFTHQYRKLLDAMPLYFNVASFISFRNNYVF